MELETSIHFAEKLEINIGEGSAGHQWTSFVIEGAGNRVEFTAFGADLPIKLTHFARESVADAVGEIDALRGIVRVLRQSKQKFIATTEEQRAQIERLKDDLSSAVEHGFFLDGQLADAQAELRDAGEES